MRGLIACEYSGRVRSAFRARGFDAVSCDLLPAEDHSPHHIQDDVRNHLGNDWDFMIAHPTCTRMTNAGVRWLNGGMNLERATQLREDVQFYIELWKAPIPRVCLENPVMNPYAADLIAQLAADIPKRQFVQPWQFGEPMFKRTGYALRGLPQLMADQVLTPPKAGTAEHKTWSWVHRCPPGPDRWKIRSRTPQGIARAMAQQWGDFFMRSRGFCHMCGASIPHRIGEGRCNHCVQFNTETVPCTF